MVPILELVTQIMEEGRYKKNRQSEAQLNSFIMRLFKLHQAQRTEESARRVYQEIILLAELGKGDLAKKFAMRFEKEIGYE